MSEKWYEEIREKAEKVEIKPGMTLRRCLDILDESPGADGRGAFRLVVEYILKIERKRETSRMQKELLDEISDSQGDEVKELRGLLAKLIDVRCLPGHVILQKDWERACLLAGRYCEPFIKEEKKGSKG